MLCHLVIIHNLGNLVRGVSPFMNWAHLGASSRLELPYKSLGLGSSVRGNGP